MKNNENDCEYDLDYIENNPEFQRNYEMVQRNDAMIFIIRLLQILVLSLMIFVICFVCMRYAENRERSAEASAALNQLNSLPKQTWE